MKQNMRQMLKTILDLFNLDRVILIPILLLCAINIIIQYSATDKDIGRLINDTSFIIISLTIMVIIAQLNQNHMKVLAMPLYIVLIIMLIGVVLWGVNINGAKRWLNIGIRIQPSELAKLTIPLVLSHFFALREKPYRIVDFFIAFVLLIIPFLLIAKQPDLGTAILVLLSGFYVLLLADLPWKFILFCAIVLLLSTPVIWHFLHPYQQHRILTLLNPQSDPLGKGYHIIQGMIAIGSGGFWGKGYLQGTQTHLNFIPEKNTDFVITVVAEEFGYLGIIVILALYLLIILRGLQIMTRSENYFSKLLCGSITLSFASYVFINMGMVAGVFPVVGVPLPLISYGGTATIVIMAGLGIILSIAKINNNKT
jgi:rod shape determining protein RodA